MRPFSFLKDNEALVLRALRPFIDERDGKKERFVEDEYLFKGPATYIPRVEESIMNKVESYTVLPNTGILLKAKRDITDSAGILRKTGTSVIFENILILLVVTP